MTLDELLTLAQECTRRYADQSQAAILARAIHEHEEE